MKLSPKRLFVALTGLMFSGSALALPGLTNSYSQDVIVIENNIDGNTLITPVTSDPRIIGTNGATGEYNPNTTESVLGYIGHGEPRPVLDGQYVDIWLEGFPAVSPIRGLACVGLEEWECFEYVEPTRMDKQGVYKMPIEYLDGQHDHAVLSMSAFIAYRNMKVGKSFTFVYNSCMTEQDYELSMGETCAKVEPSAWKRYGVTHNKVAHLKLNNTNANAEVFINTDGIPSLGLGGQICNLSNVGGVDGLTCSIVDYSMEGQVMNSNNIRVQMNLDDSMLGFLPTASQIKYRVSSGTWTNYNAPLTFSQFSQGNKIEVFFSNDFMKRLLTETQILIDGSDMSKLFFFMLENAVAGDEGRYRFSSSSSLFFRSESYGISIIPIKAIGRGQVGSSEPLKLSYNVITTGPRQADLITVVIAGNHNVDGTPYCIFDSPDYSIDVKFPLYIGFKDQLGVEQMKYSGCANVDIDITNALWTRGGAVNDVVKGYTYSTLVDMIFPMDDPISQKQSNGRNDWAGIVRAEGRIIVTATWRNVKSN